MSRLLTPWNRLISLGLAIIILPFATLIQHYPALNGEWRSNSLLAYRVVNHYYSAHVTVCNLNKFPWKLTRETSIQGYLRSPYSAAAVGRDRLYDIQYVHLCVDKTDLPGWLSQWREEAICKLPLTLVVPGMQEHERLLQYLNNTCMHIRKGQSILKSSCLLDK